MENLTIEGKTQVAMQMVIMDAMEKGNTNKLELINYMKTNVFAKAVKRYVSMM